ncbi:MAG: hypothetical protein ACTHYK_14340 [Brevibacterium aurantiacum]
MTNKSQRAGVTPEGGSPSNPTPSLTRFTPLPVSVVGSHLADKGGVPAKPHTHLARLLKGICASIGGNRSVAT